MCVFLAACIFFDDYSLILIAGTSLRTVCGVLSLSSPIPSLLKCIRPASLLIFSVFPLFRLNHSPNLVDDEMLLLQNLTSEDLVFLGTLYPIDLHTVMLDNI